MKVKSSSSELCCSVIFCVQALPNHERSWTGQSNCVPGGTESSISVTGVVIGVSIVMQKTTRDSQAT